MKSKIYILLILIIATNVVPNSIWSQDLSKLPENERNSKLIEIAKNVYKAPRLKNFYREFGTPTITEMKTRKLPDEERKKLQNDPNNLWADGENEQKFYIVYFHYDMNKERFAQGYAAKVYIWENTGKAFAIGLGSMIMLPVKDGMIPNHNKQPEPVVYYPITYSKDVPNASTLPKTGKFGDLVTINLKTTTTVASDGWTTERGYNFDANKDVTGGQVIFDSQRDGYREGINGRTIQIMVAGNLKINVTKYVEEYEDPY